MSDFMTTPIRDRDDYGRTVYTLPSWGKAIAVKIPRGDWFVNTDRFGIAHPDGFKRERDIVNGLTRKEALALVVKMGRWERDDVTGEFK